MPASPKTPTHSRRTSSISHATPNALDTTPRRNSKASINSPHTPLRSSFHRSDSIGIDVFNSGGVIPSNVQGLGNLADELADAWSEDEEEDGEEEEDEPDMNFHQGGSQGETTRDSGVDVTSAMTPKPTNANLLLPEGRGHRRKPSDYDGSDYGGSDLEEEAGIPPGLMARMDLVESLARRGTEDSGTERDGVVGRVVNSLKDLGGQSGVEGGATRLISAHSALSTYLLHQTRLLQSLTYPLFSPLSMPPDEEFISELAPILAALNESIPRPTTAAFTALSQLHASTSDLVQTLNYLSDTLHMSRQTTTTASRRLKSARELVAEMRRDEDAREEGERWLSQGNWSERLGRRECAGVTRDVVCGFEEVCEGWRRRLVAQAEAVPA